MIDFSSFKIPFLFIFVLVILWLLAKFAVWQITGWIRKKFQIDITIKSVGFLTAYDIIIRVNQLQTIEIEKISLKLNLLKQQYKHLVFIDFGEVRVRADMKPRHQPPPHHLLPRHQQQVDDDVIMDDDDDDETTAVASKLMKQKKRLYYFQLFFKYCNLNMESFNVMILHLLLPDSLLHLNTGQITLTSSSPLGGALSIANINGKILKSTREEAEGTSCLVELSSSLQVAVEAEMSATTQQLEVKEVDLKLDHFHLEVHEGAVVPGILLPLNGAREQVGNATKVKDGNEILELQIRTNLDEMVGYLPCKTSLVINNFLVAFYGDETMGETSRGAHVDVACIQFTQLKNTKQLIKVFETHPSGHKSLFHMPTGFANLQIDDVTLTDYDKHKVAKMGKSRLECKLSSNGVFSSSLDLTSWHADYKHRESVEFWRIILNKIEDGRIMKEKKLKNNHENFTRQPPTMTSSTTRLRRQRLSSYPAIATTTAKHPDILQGISDYDVTQQQHDNQQVTKMMTSEKEAVTSSSSSWKEMIGILDRMGISNMLEVTLYDASIKLHMTSLRDDDVVEDEQLPPSVTISLDNLTGIFDQSCQSPATNHMLKIDGLVCVVSEEKGTNSEENYLTGLTYHPTTKHKKKYHQWGHLLILENLNLHGSVTFNPRDDDTTPSSTPRDGDTPLTSPRDHVRDDDVIVISMLIESKICGIQLEISEMVNSLIRSFLQAADKHIPASPTSDASKKKIIEKKRKIFKITCLESEVTDVNMFVLSTTNGCFVSRIDLLKLEMSDNDNNSERNTSKRLIIHGIGATMLSNIQLVPSPVHHNKKYNNNYQQQQYKITEYYCCQAKSIRDNYLAIDFVELCHSILHHPTTHHHGNGDVITNHNNATQWKPVKREVVLRVEQLPHEGATFIQVKWSPHLHAIVHYGIKQLHDLLTTPADVTTTSDVSKTNVRVRAATMTSPPDGVVMTSSSSSRRNVRSWCGDLDHRAIFPPESESESLGGGGANTGVGGKPSVEEGADEGGDVILFDVNISPMEMMVELGGGNFISFLISTFRCGQDEEKCVMNFDQLKIRMNNQHDVLTFNDVTILLERHNQLATDTRKKFDFLHTKVNRAWSFTIASMGAFFPHKFDFAHNFDQFITCFKWVKSLYKKKSHPFRSSKLPPDLHIKIEDFIMEIEDWRFEVKLNDNHQLICDEWKESEIRKRVLDQRVSDIRKQRGELLPAKQVEELYRKLSERNIKIFLDRSRKIHQNPPKCVLLTWTIHKFDLTALTDASMHGMTNAMKLIEEIDHVSPFPFSYQHQDMEPSFVTLWCRAIILNIDRHQARIRDYPKSFMDFNNWKISGKFCAAEQKGAHRAQRIETIELPAPLEDIKVERNMPPLKFYYQLSSQVDNFNVAWGPCWEPAWAQVNLALNLLTKTTIDSSKVLPWWDKSRLLFHGDLNFKMERTNLLHLASLDPYNTTEHMLWDWKNMTWDWKPGHFLFKGDLDIHLRTASKYDDVRFLHLPSLILDCPFTWICNDGRNPNDHHRWLPRNPIHNDVTIGGEEKHDSYRYFRSANLDLNLIFDTRNSDESCDDKPEVLLYSSAMKWLQNFFAAVNAVVRPICKGKLFKHVVPPKLKLSRQYRNINLHFYFPQLHFYYWSSYAQQLGVELICSQGMIQSQFNLQLIPYDDQLKRRPMSKWSVTSTTSSLTDTKIYLLARQCTRDDDVTISSSSPGNSPGGGSTSSGSSSTAAMMTSSTCPSLHGVQRYFFLSLSEMTYKRDDVTNGDHGDHVVTSQSNKDKSPVVGGGSGASSVMTSQYNDVSMANKRHRHSNKKTKKPTSPTKRPQNSQTLIVHDLRAMWTTETRDVVYGLYDAYEKAAVLRHNLSTNILRKIGFEDEKNDYGKTPVSTPGSADSPMTSSSAMSINSAANFDVLTVATGGGMDSNMMTSSSHLPHHSSTMSRSDSLTSQSFHQQQHLELDKLLRNNDGNRYALNEMESKGEERRRQNDELLKGKISAEMDDIVNRNWSIHFINCQAMLKGPKTHGYIILTAAEAEFINHEHRITWRDGQLTTKMSWCGSLSGTQVFATVDRNATSSGQDGESVPWLAVGDIAPRGPSPGMLDINELMGSGQAIGGVVRDGGQFGVSAGSYQLQRIMSRTNCRMFYVGYEALVDTEQTDYQHILPSSSQSTTHHTTSHMMTSQLDDDLLGKEKPINVLTILQDEIEICTNTSQYNMILDIVENLILYVEPVMRDHRERVERMRFALRLTSFDNVSKHRHELATKQNTIRSRLTNLRELQRRHYQLERNLEKDGENWNLLEQNEKMLQCLKEEKETLKLESEELGIIIRCFKEVFLERRTMNVARLARDNMTSRRMTSASIKSRGGGGVDDMTSHEEEEPLVVRTTEVLFGKVKWNLTDRDGQLNIAQFEMNKFYYEKINKSDEAVCHSFELGWLRLQNLLPTAIYRDVIRPRHTSGHGKSTSSIGSVLGIGGQSLMLRVLCKVRAPVGGISVKEHLEINAAPLIIQCEKNFYTRVMQFFFPNDNDVTIHNNNHQVVTSAHDQPNLLGVPRSSMTSLHRNSLVPGGGTGHQPLGSTTGTMSSSVSLAPSTMTSSSSNTHRRNKSQAWKQRTEDDVEKMKNRAANNNTFLYIKITQVPFIVSYKGEKDKNLADLRDFKLTIPMLEYHSVTWTWHDFAIAVKKESQKMLFQQILKEKLFRSGKGGPTSASGGSISSNSNITDDTSSSSATSSATSSEVSTVGIVVNDNHRNDQVEAEKKANILLGSNLFSNSSASADSSSTSSGSRKSSSSSSHHRHRGPLRQLLMTRGKSKMKK